MDFECSRRLTLPVLSLFSLLLFAGLSTPALYASSEHWGNLEAGAYHVGFRVERIRDATRSIRVPDTAERSFEPRPLVLTIWYPIVEPTAARLTASRYFDISADERFIRRPSRADETAQRRSRVLARIERWGAKPEEVSAILSSPVAAYHGGAAVPEALPLVILAPMPLSPPTHSWVLAEYLASHGFVVAGYPPYGLLPGFMDVGGIDLETQVRDLEFVLAHLLAGTDTAQNRAAVIGHSWSGLVAVAAQLRSPRLAAVVSLDGSEEYWRDVLEQRPNFDLLRLRVPYLRFVRPGVTDSGFFDSVRFAPKWRIEVANLTHGELAYMPLLRAETSGSEGKRVVFETLCRIIRAFVTHQLGTGSARRPQDPLSSFRDAPGVRSIEHAPGIDPLADEASLVRLWQAEGTDAVLAVARRLRQRDPAGRSEEILIRFAELLMWTARFPADAERVLRQLLLWFPDAPALHEHLGNNAWMAGDGAAAEVHFARALTLDPLRFRVRESLKDLRSSNDG